MTLFVALDIETTGLFPKEDKILEIAWQITNEHFVPLTPLRSYLVHHDEDGWAEVWSQLRVNEVVRNMHEKSGLLNDLKASRAFYPAVLALTLRDDIMLHRQGDEDVHLAGFSIGFDRSFLVEEKGGFWQLIETDVLGVQLHHRLMDFSSVKLLWESIPLAKPEIENPGAHRAKNDVLEVVQFGQAIRGQLLSMVGA